MINNNNNNKNCKKNCFNQISFLNLNLKIIYQIKISTNSIIIYLFKVYLKSIIKNLTLRQLVQKLKNNLKKLDNQGLN